MGIQQHTVGAMLGGNIAANSQGNVGWEYSSIVRAMLGENIAANSRGNVGWEYRSK